MEMLLAKIEAELLPLLIDRKTNHLVKHFGWIHFKECKDDYSVVVEFIDALRNGYNISIRTLKELDKLFKIIKARNLALNVIAPALKNVTASYILEGRWSLKENGLTDYTRVLTWDDDNMYCDDEVIEDVYFLHTKMISQGLL